MTCFIPPHGYWVCGLQEKEAYSCARLNPWYSQITTASNDQLHHSMIAPWPAISHYSENIFIWVIKYQELESSLRLSVTTIYFYKYFICDKNPPYGNLYTSICFFCNQTLIHIYHAASYIKYYDYTCVYSKL